MSKKTTKKQQSHAFCSEVTLLKGFASKPVGVKKEPPKINVLRAVYKTKNIENTTPQTPRNRDWVTDRRAALGELKLGPYKTWSLPKLVQVVF